MDNERLGRQPDFVQSLSPAEVSKKQKERADKLKQKYGISENVDQEHVIANESRIHDEHKKAVSEVEQEFSKAEGNIAEQLATAAEHGDDGDIILSLQQAKQYHQASGQYAQAKLFEKQKAYISRIFGNHLPA